MKTNPTNSSNSTIKVVGAILVVGTIGISQPSLANVSSYSDTETVENKKVNYVDALAWDTSTFRVGVQRPIATRNGPVPDEFDFDYNIDLRSIAVDEFVATATIVSIEDGEPVIDIEEIYYED